MARLLRDAFARDDPTLLRRLPQRPGLGPPTQKQPSLGQALPEPAVQASTAASSASPIRAIPVLAAYVMTIIGSLEVSERRDDRSDADGSPHNQRVQVRAMLTKES